MSIDSRDPSAVDHSQVLLDHWESSCQRIRKNVNRRTGKKVFGSPFKRGRIYRWGLGVALPANCHAESEAIISLATGQPIGKKQGEQLNFLGAAESFTEWLRTATDHTAADALATNVWAAALPDLIDELEPPIWCDLFGSILRFREAVLQRSQHSAVGQLMIGAELGLTLTWRCDGLPGTDGLNSSALGALNQWAEASAESLSAALENPLQTRLVLASALRCRQLVHNTTNQLWTKQANALVDELATWVAAMTVTNGSSAFSQALPGQFKDDMGNDGLLEAVGQIDPERLPGAISAALGKTPAGGRLAWQVTLPEAMHHDPNAKLAVMFADWDTRRGRTHVDYANEDVTVEIFAGRTKVIAGDWQAIIETDGAEQRPTGPWDEICEYTDDDVHYLELEQAWTDGLLLQRQFMLVRDDRCLLLADSIVHQDAVQQRPKTIKYTARFPLAPSIRLTPEAETREAFLGDDRKRALVIPMSASEWTVGPTDATIQQSTDDCLVLTSSGSRSLYAPIWFDFQKRRFKRKRTWRQLTIADQLRLVGRDEAVGYRIQVGSEQWVVYRSLADRVCRSFLGKHLIADFFSARFDPEDGGHEVLVTVDDEADDE